MPGFLTSTANLTESREGRRVSNHILFMGLRGATKKAAGWGIPVSEKWGLPFSHRWGKKLSKV